MTHESTDDIRAEDIWAERWAKSIADMVINWIGSGGGEPDKWQPGLPVIIKRRLQRLMHHNGFAPCPFEKPATPDTTKETTIDRNAANMHAHALSSIEDEVLAAFSVARDSGADPRWMAIAITNLQLGFMAAKRACYDGKRVTDDKPAPGVVLTESPANTWQTPVHDAAPGTTQVSPPVNKAP